MAWMRQAAVAAVPFGLAVLGYRAGLRLVGRPSSQRAGCQWPFVAGSSSLSLKVTILDSLRLLWITLLIC
jgi:hypothetical protein